MKFKNVKPGDIVYVQKGIEENLFGKVTYFWIPAAVERVTSKRFIVDGKSYRKDDGKKTGGYDFVYYLGDEYKGGKICDESEKMVLFLEKRAKRQSILDIANRLLNIKSAHPELDDIYILSLDINKLLTANKAVNV